MFKITNSQAKCNEKAGCLVKFKQPAREIYNELI